MLLRQKILYAALPLGCLLLHGQAHAGRAMEDPRQPPLKIVNYALRSQTIEPTKLGMVPAPAIQAAREEKAATQAAPEAPTPMSAPVPKPVKLAEASGGLGVALDVVPWQRDCVAMGYPADYLGIVAGETVIDRAAGVRRDVWLRNDCIAPHDAPAATEVAVAEAVPEIAPNTELLAARQPPELPEPEVVAAAAPKISEPALHPNQEAKLVTPRLPGSVMMDETIHQSAELHSTAALVTPRLEHLALNHDPAPGVTNYRPAPPIRSGAELMASPGGEAGVLDAELEILALAPDASAPDEATLQRLETVGNRLAGNRLAQLTVTAYASLTPERDARAARRLSLNRALAVRDALMLGGAGSEQVRLRALGANVPSGDPDRIDVSEN